MALQLNKVYSGKAGKCMCGCVGKWTYTKNYQQGPGYEVTVNERVARRHEAMILNDPNMKQEDGGLVIHTIVGERFYAAYYTEVKAKEEANAPVTFHLV